MEETVLKIVRDTKAWKGAQDSIANLPKSLVHAGHNSLTATLPHSSVVTGTNTWTIHTDAAWDGASGSCGLGWHLRDPVGDAQLNFSSNRRFVPSALVAEALAVKAALSMAAARGIQHIKVFSDCKNLVSLINKKERDISVVNVLSDVTLLVCSFSSVSFHFIPRLENAAADSLAKLALLELQNSPLSE